MKSSKIRNNLDIYIHQKQTGITRKARPIAKTCFSHVYCGQKVARIYHRHQFFHQQFGLARWDNQQFHLTFQLFSWTSLPPC